jgi:hypothetical protein
MAESISNHAIDRAINLSGGGGVGEAAGNTDFKEYPRNFFDVDTGKGPKDAQAAALLWPFRTARKKKGEVETETPDGAAMLNEVNKMRLSLREYVSQSFLEGARKAASEQKLLMPDTNNIPVVLSDIQKSLCALERISGKLDAEQTVYKVCHEFHHSRDWVSDVVDMWFAENKIILLSQEDPGVVEGKQQRVNPRNRGGFSTVARNMKNQQIGNLTRVMLSGKNGWTVAVTCKKSKTQTYQQISLVGKEGNAVKAYCVTANKAVNEVRSWP